MNQQIVSAPKEDVLAAGIEALRSQIILLKKRTAGDDLTQRLFDSALLSVDHLTTDFNTRLDAEAEDYNTLVGRFETFHERTNQSMLAISKLTGSDVTLDNIQNVLQELVESRNQELERVSIQYQQAITMRASAESELRGYKKLYPPSLVARMETAEKDNRSLKKERRELRETVTDLNQKYVKSTGELTSSRKRLVELQSVAESLKEECYRLGQELNSACGMASRPETFPMMYKGNDAIGYIHTFPHGLSANSKLRGEVLISANVHYQIRTNWLLTMDVVPSIWGVPLYFRMPGFAEDWNTDIDECLRDKIIAFIEQDFPRLHARIHASQAAPVDQLKMRPETMAEIKSANFPTVYSVACIPAEFHPSIPFMQGECRQEIVDACRVWANEWDRDNGGVEDLYDASYRAPVTTNNQQC